MDYEFRIKQGRLAKYTNWDNKPDDWEKYWSTHDVKELVSNQISLEDYEIMTRYLPRDFPIIEAGCGIGKIVLALARKGYKVEGIDFSERVVNRVREVIADINIRVGDIYHIDAPDAFYGGYISLGVLEHNPDGPLEGLREARRVLNPLGYAFFSVPYLNFRREKLIKKLELLDRRKSNNEYKFYQFYFSRNDFTNCLIEAGFNLIQMIPVLVSWGMVYDSSVVGWLSRHDFFNWRLYNLFWNKSQQSPMFIRRYWAHMALFICKPRN